MREHGVVLLIHVVPRIQDAVTAGHEENTWPVAVRPDSHSKSVLHWRQAYNLHIAAR